jgi:hypothetical protein
MRACSRSCSEENDRHGCGRADEAKRDREERELVPAIVAEGDHADRDTQRYAAQPRRDEAPRQRRDREPAREKRQRVRGVAARGDVVVVRELPDSREDDDRDEAGDPETAQKNRRTPRKSLVRTGTIRTELAEFGASIMRPPPMYMATWPTTGCS